MSPFSGFITAIFIFSFDTQIKVLLLLLLHNYFLDFNSLFVLLLSEGDIFWGGITTFGWFLGSFLLGSFHMLVDPCKKSKVVGTKLQESSQTNSGYVKFVSLG